MRPESDLDPRPFEPRPFPSATATAELRAEARRIAAAANPVGAECQRILDALRQRCPGVLPPDPLKPGSVGPEIALNPDEFTRLVQAAAVPRSGAKTLHWVSGDNELLVDAAAVKVELAEGLVRVRIPVRCDQVRSAAVLVAFAVGDSKRPAGLLAATESRPRGPAAVVDLWGEALTAFAWRAFLGVAGAVAEQAGSDLDGAGLVPAAFVSTANGVRILTMARQEFDRVTR